MSDDDLRGRFRRDFTNEVIDSRSKQAARPAPQPAQRPPVTDLRSRQAEAAAQPMFPSVMSDSPAEPRHQAPAHQPHPEPASREIISQPKITKRRGYKKLALALILVIITAAAGAFVWQRQDNVPIPLSTRSSLDFALLYPAKLPAGYKIDQASFNISQGSLLYTASNSDPSQKIDFTVKKLPGGFNFSAFYNKGLTNADVFNTPAGQAATGTAGGRLLGSLHTNESWMLASPESNNLNANDLKLMLQGVKSAPVPKDK